MRVHVSLVYLLLYWFDGNWMQIKILLLFKIVFFFSNITLNNVIISEEDLKILKIYSELVCLIF